MKKCIVSFLVFFVFAFGVITAFGCRNEVYASEVASFDASKGGYLCSGSSEYGVNFKGTLSFDEMHHGAYDYDYCGNSYDFRLKFSDCSTEITIYPLYAWNGTRYSIVFVPVSTEPFKYSFDYDYSSVDASGNVLRTSYCTPSEFHDAAYYNEYGLYAVQCGFSSSSFNNVTYDCNYSYYFYENYSFDEVLEEIYNQSFSGNLCNQGLTWTLSPDIGYLKDLRVVQKNYENSATHQLTHRIYSFSWGYESSTGVDLSDSRYALDIKARLEYKDLAFDDLKVDDSPLCNSFKYDSNWNALYNSAVNCQNAYDSDNIFTRSGFNTIYYFRIVDTVTNTCGVWLKADIDFTGLTEISLTGETGAFDESDVWIGDGNEVPLIAGMQNGDNESTLVYSDSTGQLDFSNMSNSLNSLVDGVGQVPQIIATLFSWLPPWVIVFLSVCIAIWGIFIVKKAIFG